jgi:transcriptional regulator with XRE-family HTH domain
MDISNNKWISMSDTALLGTIGHFVQHHRLKQNKTQQQVAAEAGINRSTLSQLENGETTTTLTLMQVLRVLDKLEIMETFTVRQQVSPIQLAQHEKSKRKRARNKPADSQPESDW